MKSIKRVIKERDDSLSRLKSAEETFGTASVAFLKIKLVNARAEAASQIGRKHK